MKFTEKIYKVSEINSISRDLLEKEFPLVAVEGEISNFTKHSSGHMYFTVKDDKASIDAVMYKSFGRYLNFKPERGTKVIVTGKLSLYVKGGRFQLLAWEMKEKGRGDLEKKFLELKEKLKNEGLFDEKYKKPIPAVPGFIGIVTSPTGAAIRDILNVINRRFSDIKVLLYPCRVQGDKAAEEITAGINTFNELCPAMDLMIVGRGGGSIEDLWPFNEESVARAIFKSDIPVISAVGHEVDFTISDFVADLRSPTPSAAAEMAVKDKAELVKKLNRLTGHIRSTMEHKVLAAKNRIRGLIASPVFKYPLRLVEQREQDIDYMTSHITKDLKYLINKKQHRFENLTAQLSSLSPKEVLKRGYTFTCSNNKIVTDAAKLKKGDKLQTVFYKGSAESEIINLGDK
jgi:exodeoxyribonuclease VII large subunit